MKRPRSPQHDAAKQTHWDRKRACVDARDCRPLVRAGVQALCPGVHQPGAHPAGHAGAARVPGAPRAGQVRGGSGGLEGVWAGSARGQRRDVSSARAVRAARLKGLWPAAPGVRPAPCKRTPAPPPRRAQPGRRPGRAAVRGGEAPQGRGGGGGPQEEEGAHLRPWESARGPGCSGYEPRRAARGPHTCCDCARVFVVPSPLGVLWGLCMSERLPRAQRSRRRRRRAPRRWRSFAATCAPRSAPTRSTRCAAGRGACGWGAAAGGAPLPGGQGCRPPAGLKRPRPMAADDSARGDQRSGSERAPSPLPCWPAPGIDALPHRLFGPQVIGREREVARVMQILARRTKNNPILLGEPGEPLV